VRGREGERESVEYRWNQNWQGKANYSETTLSHVALSTKNLTFTVLGLNPILRDEKPVINLFGYVTNKMTLNEISATRVENSTLQAQHSHYQVPCFLPYSFLDLPLTE
jgi:hypothetical protein